MTCYLSAYLTERDFPWKFIFLMCSATSGFTSGKMVIRKSKIINTFEFWIHKWENGNPQNRKS